jgi:hypothetical protein
MPHQGGSVRYTATHPGAWPLPLPRADSFAVFFVTLHCTPSGVGRSSNEI